MEIPQQFSNEKATINSTNNKIVHKNVPQKENDKNLGSVFDFLFTPDEEDLDQSNKTIPSFKNISASLPSMLINDTAHETPRTTEAALLTTLRSTITHKPTTKKSATKIHSTTKHIDRKTSSTTLRPPETTTHIIAAPQSPNYAINPIDFDKMRHHHSEGAMEIFSKPTLASMNGLLKLAGCNIYGRMYRVGKIITELSTECLECKCTEIGVSCLATAIRTNC